MSTPIDDAMLNAGYVRTSEAYRIAGLSQGGKTRHTLESACKPVLVREQDGAERRYYRRACVERLRDRRAAKSVPIDSVDALREEVSELRSLVTRLCEKIGDDA